MDRTITIEKERKKEKKVLIFSCNNRFKVLTTTK